MTDKARVTAHHIAERTCLACRQVKPKHLLIRLVHALDGTIEIDEQGRKKGRGAYLCKKRPCWETALAKGRKDRLAQALRTEVTAEHRAALMEFGKTLPCDASLLGNRGVE